MSKHNYAGIAFSDNLRKNPDLFNHLGPDGELSEKFNKQLAESAKARQALDAKNTKERTTLPDLRKEYNELRQRLFNLNQDAKCFETRTNEAAGKMRLLEQQINDAIKQKKAAADEGNGRGERTHENAILRLESELADATEEFTKNKHWSGQAARSLRDFDGYERLAELKLLLDAPLPEAKSESVPK